MGTPTHMTQANAPLTPPTFNLSTHTHTSTRNPREPSHVLAVSTSSAFETVSPTPSVHGDETIEYKRNEEQPINMIQEERNHNHNIGQLSYEAQEAVSRVQQVQKKVTQYLSELESSPLSNYERPRIHAIIVETMVLCNINLHTHRHTKHDLARLVRTCRRRYEALYQLYVEARAVITEGRHDEVPILTPTERALAECDSWYSSLLPQDHNPI